MIKITITRNPDNQVITSYLIEGHALYLPKGMDIVCAAVSVLSIAITNELYGGHTLSDEGRLHVFAIPPNEQNRVLTDALYHGLTDIAMQYKDNLQVIEV